MPTIWPAKAEVPVICITIFIPLEGFPPEAGVCLNCILPGFPPLISYVRYMSLAPFCPTVPSSLQLKTNLFLFFTFTNLYNFFPSFAFISLYGSTPVILKFASFFSSSDLLKFTFSIITFSCSTFFKDKGNNSPSSIKSKIKLFNSTNVKLLDLVSGSVFNVFKSFTALLEPKYISAGDHLLISPNFFWLFAIEDCVFADLNSSDIVPMRSSSPLK